MQGRIFVALLVLLAAHANRSSAALITNPARPIKHQVTIQIIQTALDNGSAPATVFGNSSQAADIEAKVDSIWAQAGIDIAFLPTITSYDNTFAYQGGGGDRPSSDLNAILASAQGAGVMHSDPSVINMFFVNIVPGFAQLSEYSVAGLAQIGNDGIAQYVGDNLLTSSGNREIVAGVVAHEIGHNLGLKHTADGQANLMSPDGATEQLSEAQVAAIFQTARRNDSVAFIPTGGTDFPQLVDVIILAGDYNKDGVVNAADYSVWRDSIGSTMDLAADGNDDRIVDSGDYLVWKTNFGRVAATGAGSLTSVPEPSTVAPFLIAVLCGIAGRGVRNRRAHMR